MVPAGKKAKNLYQPSDLDSPEIQSFYQILNALACETFPSLAGEPPIKWPNVVSPSKIRLPLKIYESAKNAIQSLFQLSENPSYRDEFLEPEDISSPQSSVLMAYDFHCDASGDLRLIEVNTNASGFLFSALTIAAHEKKSPEKLISLEQLKESFRAEVRGFNDSRLNSLKVAITDENWQSQRMRAEFFMYRDLFSQMGWQAQIVESSDFAVLKNQLVVRSSQQNIDLVYNRTTDFHLSASQHEALRQAYEKRLACITPSPKTYRLLADKHRLIDWGLAQNRRRWNIGPFEETAITRVLLKTEKVSNYSDLDEIWSRRKDLFLKPRQGHGGKSVYRGSSISRKVFDRLVEDRETILQEYFPAHETAGWKYDLRFFVYRDQIQQVIARSYQGQVTNFSTPLGGFTYVEFLT